MKKLYPVLFAFLLLAKGATGQQLQVSIARDPNPNNANPVQTIRVTGTPVGGTFSNQQAWNQINFWFRFPKSTVRDENKNIYVPNNANTFNASSDATNVSTGFSALNPRNQFTSGLDITFVDKPFLTVGLSADDGYWYFAISGTASNNQGFGVGSSVNIWTFSFPASWGLCGSCLEIIQTQIPGVLYQTTPSIQIGFPSVNVATFANFTSPLPLELTNFTATKISSSRGQLDWITAQEKELDHFEVERSADGRYFSTVVGKAVAHNTSDKSTYTLLDKTPLPGDNYYRLKIVEQDGGVKYSEVRKLNFDRNLNGIVVKKNPFTDFTEIKVTAEAAQSASYTVTDVTGRVIMYGQWNVAAGENNYNLDLQGFASGTYMLTVKGATVEGQAKLLKVE